MNTITKVVHLHDFCNTVIIAPAKHIDKAVAAVTRAIKRFGTNRKTKKQ